MNRKLGPNEVKVADLQQIAFQRQNQEQQLEIQLRATTAELAIRGSENGESVEKLKERLDLLKKFLFTGMTE